MNPPTTPPIHTGKPGLSFKGRLVSGYLVLVLLFAVFSLLAAEQVNSLVSAGQELDRQTRTVFAAQELSNATLELAREIDESILLQDVSRYLTTIPQARQEIERQHRLVQELAAGTAGLDEPVAELLALLEPLRSQAELKDWGAVQRLRSQEVSAAVDSLTAETARLVELSSTAQQAALDAAARSRTTALRSLAIFSALALLAALAAGWAVIAHLSGRLHTLTAAADRLATGSLDVNLEPGPEDEIGALAQAFNRMSAQFRTQYEQQESRIALRTAELEATSTQLQTAAEVARVATTLLDPQALLSQVVDMVSARFGFYHTGIFLVDESGALAVLSAASSQGGKRMLERGHRLLLGQGIVGYAILQGKAHIATDTGKDAVFFNNPDLPGTRSEAALPMRARGKVIGALDVQSMEVQGFTEANTTILQTLADQVALALDNARLYQESQGRLEEVRRLYGEYGQRAWDALAKRREVPGYRYTPYTGVTPAVVDYDEEVERPPEQAGEPGLDLPVLVRDRRVGSLTVRKPAGSGGWTGAEVEMLEKIVEQLGVALEGARLYGETQRRVERERLLGTVTAQMRETLDIHTVLRTAARQIRESLGLPEVTVRLSPQDGAPDGSDAGARPTI